jgi:glutamine phosphoribosylpyrophosphate amidotransferase
MQEDDDDEDEVDEEIPEEPGAGTEEIMDAMMDQGNEEVKVQHVSPPKNQYDVGFGINVTQQQEDLKRHRSKIPDLSNPS